MSSSRTHPQPSSYTVEETQIRRPDGTVVVGLGSTLSLGEQAKQSIKKKDFPATVHRVESDHALAFAHLQGPKNQWRIDASAIDVLRQQSQIVISGPGGEE